MNDPINKRSHEAPSANSACIGDHDILENRSHFVVGFGDVDEASASRLFLLVVGRVAWKN